MSGCIIIKGIPSSTQLNVIGKVQITTTACASDDGHDNSGYPAYPPGDPDCQGSPPSHGGNFPGDASDATVQYKIAYRIPDTVVPAASSFPSTNATCNSGITFNYSPSYTTALQGLSAAGSGRQWVGYLSTVQNYSTSTCQYFTVSPEFTLNQSGGNPFQGPFNYRVVVGYRQVNEGVPGNTSARAVTCGSTAITSSYRDGADTNSDGNPDMIGICADSPDPSTISGTDLSQTTRDLGVVPTNTTVDAGATASVPFNLKYAGASGSGAFTVAASTDVPGATATPSITTLTPAADSNNNMTVSVPVPGGTAPGTYHVTVTATLGNGQSRIGTANLTVGALAFNVSPVLPSLGTVALNGQAQNKTAQMNNFGVNDTTASPSGWNVTVQGNTGSGLSKVFKQYCPAASAPCGSDPAGYVSGGLNLSADSLTLNTTAASWTGGTGSTPTFQCNAGCSVDHNTANKIASAASGGGTGLWSTSGFSATSLSLATPSTLRVLPANEQYRLNVVWTLNSGP